jgi:hypothetical protein
MAQEKSSGDGEKRNPKPTFTIFVNNNSVEVAEHELSGAAIKSRAGVPADYELFEVKGDKTEPVGNDQVVHIHNNAHFRAIPAGTFGINASTA